MSKQLVTDEFWEVVEPLLPKHEASAAGGRPRVPDRVCLTGILFLLKTGLPWEDFPQEMGCSGMTLWNRFNEWNQAGVWEELHAVLLDKLRAAGKLEMDRVVVDSSSVRAMHGGKKRDPAPSTAENRAPNTIWRSMPTASRWRRRSPAPTGTT